MDVAETRYEERDAEKHHAQLQTHREEHLQLLFGEVFIAHLALHFISVKGRIRVAFVSNKRHNEHNAQMNEGENPEEDAGSDSIHRSAL